MKKMKVGITIIAIEIGLTILGLIGFGPFKIDPDFVTVNDYEILLIFIIVVLIFKMAALRGIYKSEKGFAFFVIILGVIALLPNPEMIRGLLLITGGGISLIAIYDIDYKM